MTLFVHSIDSFGTLDGPGIRLVIFLSGCPLKCQYCHNPDTWSLKSGHPYTVETLFLKIRRMVPYFGEKGGVTFSGGDPLMQASALKPLLKRLNTADIHVALDTSGALWNKDIEALLPFINLVLLDIKHTHAPSYYDLTGGELSDTLFFLNQIKNAHIPYWIRQVIVPELNDTKEQLLKLNQLTMSVYREKIELLPFHKNGLHKWTALNKVCPLEHHREPSNDEMNILRAFLS